MHSAFMTIYVTYWCPVGLLNDEYRYSWVIVHKNTYLATCQHAPCSPAPTKYNGVKITKTNKTLEITEF